MFKLIIVFCLVLITMKIVCENECNCEKEKSSYVNPYGKDTTIIVK